MALIGNIGSFDASMDNWSSYSERLGQFYEANDIADDKKVAVLLSVIGGKTYDLLRSLTAPQRPAEKSFAELCEILEAHFSPRPLIIAERFRFYKRNQRSGETISEYCAALQRLTEHCNFGTTLSDALRDRLVCGLANEHVQRKLLVEADLTYERAKAIAIAAEAAARDAEELRRQPSAEVNKVKAQQATARARPQTADKRGTTTTYCTRCGKNNHDQSQCYFRDKCCLNCSKIGHTKKMCHSKVKLNQPKRQTITNRVQRINELSDTNSEDDFGLLPMNFVEASENNTVNRVTVKPIVIAVSVNNHSIEMELDSGSPVSLIPSTLYNKLFTGVALKPSELHLSTFTGESLQVLGVMDVTVKYGEKHYSLKLHVVSQGNTALFGRDWLKEIKLDWKEIIWVNSIQPKQLSLSGIKTRYAHLFKDELGKLVNFTAKLHLKETAVPVFMRARSVPYAMRPKIEQELNRLEKEGVLTKSSRSEWGTPIVPIVKQNGQLRLCGDYKITVNPALLIDKYPLPKPQDIFASLAGGQRYSKLDLRQAYLQCEVDEASKEVLTLNTHKGLYKMNRLAFGISSA